MSDSVSSRAMLRAFPTATVIYDACVLYSAMLRDALMRLAVTGLYRAVWTDAIHEEWIHAVLANRSDLTREKLDRVRALMNAHVLDSLVSGYEPLIPTIDLPDPDDRHVLAAAIHSGADVIVTFNVKDFPAAITLPLGIIAQHPDDFIQELTARDGPAVLTALRQQRMALQKPPKTAEEFVATFAAAGLPKSAATLRARLSEI
jgi:predicted nucleic acid-binding protein